MSLTSFIKRPAVREALRTAILPLRYHDNRAPLVPPPPTNAPLIGTAFDYLFRFRIARRARISHEPNDWIASLGLLYLEHFAGKRRRIYRLARDGFDAATNAVAMYRKRGRVTRALLRGALHLAHLDLCVRPGPSALREQFLTASYEEEIANLRALVAAIPEGCCEPEHTCLLNPTFGDASELVGGADADLIVDDLLVDIKTYRELRLTPEMLRQLVGYYVLLALSGEASGRPFAFERIQRLGIYFSRHGYLLELSVDDVLPPDALPLLTRLFVDQAAEVDGTDPSNYYPEFAYPRCREWWLEATGNTAEGWVQLQEDKLRFPINPHMHLCWRVGSRRSAREASEWEREELARLSALVELTGSRAAAAARLGISKNVLRRRFARALLQDRSSRRDALDDLLIFEGFRTLKRSERSKINRALRDRFVSIPTLY